MTLSWCSCILRFSFALDAVRVVCLLLGGDCSGVTECAPVTLCHHLCRIDHGSIWGLCLSLHGSTGAPRKSKWKWFGKDVLNIQQPRNKRQGDPDRSSNAQNRGADFLSVIPLGNVLTDTLKYLSGQF